MECKECNAIYSIELTICEVCGSEMPKEDWMDKGLFEGSSETRDKHIYRKGEKVDRCSTLGDNPCTIIDHLALSLNKSKKRYPKEYKGYKGVSRKVKH